MTRAATPDAAHFPASRAERATIERVTRRRRFATGRAVTLVVVLVALGLTLALPVREWVVQRAAIADLEAQVAASQQRVADLQVAQQRWQDPAFVAAQARERLHFVRPGEIGYVVLGADDKPLVAGGAVPAAEDPWWSTLWESVDAAANQ